MRRLAIAIAVLAACGDNSSPPGPAAPRGPCAVPVRGRELTARQIAYGCTQEGAPPFPGCLLGRTGTLVTSPPDDPRLFVVELDGRIRIIEDGQLRPDVFLDLSREAGGPVHEVGPELGLLGLAFHPQYATNRQFFIYYTMDNPDVATNVMYPYLNVLARYTTSESDPYRAEPASGVTLLSLLDPFANHNGGMLEFGKDGYLYVSTGDGGGSNSLPPDPYGYSQDPSSLHGKILRLDIDAQSPGKAYGIPPGNPFAAGPGGAPEVWVLGLRNPWRFGLDRLTGDLWIADVGGAVYEEVTALRAGQQAGRNLGWKMWEGPDCHAPPCSAQGMTFPQDARHHDTGFWSILAGEVYRGSCYPDLAGTFVYTDMGFSFLQGARLRADGSFELEQLSKDFVVYPTSLHADAAGELYETDRYGGVWQIFVVGDPRLEGR